MQKKFGIVLLGSMLAGVLFLGPMGLGQAVEMVKAPFNPAQQKESTVRNTNHLSASPMESSYNQSFVSRAEVATKLVDALDLNLDGYRFFEAPEVKDFFDDVPLNSPAAEAITILGYNGALNTVDRSFGPDEKMPREEMAVILANLMHQKAKISASQPGEIPSVKDLSQVDKEAVEAVQQVVGLKIMDVDQQGNFQPQQGMTQEELNKILANLKQRINTNNSDISARIITDAEGGRKVELSWGGKPSSGYEIKIIDLALEGETLNVTYQTREPSSGSYNSTAITEPKDSHSIPAQYPLNLKIQLQKK